MARSIRAAGGNANDLVHVSYGYGLFTGGLGAHYGGEHLGCTVIPMSGGQTEKQVQLIQDFDPDIIMVTPSYMLNLADEMERQGVDPHKLALRAGIFGAEPWGRDWAQTSYRPIRHLIFSNQASLNSGALLDAWTWVETQLSGLAIQLTIFT